MDYERKNIRYYLLLLSTVCLLFMILLVINSCSQVQADIHIKLT